MKKRLLLEGPDDQHVVNNLLFNHSLDDAFDLKAKEGVEKLLDTFGDELQATDIECIGVIVDADTEMLSRWGRLAHALREAGYSAVPAIPEAQGTVVREEGLVPVGIWLMPDNVAVGAIETFVSSLIDGSDLLWSKAQTDVTAIPREHRRFKDSFLAKASIHTWLAWQEEPGTRLGQVFRKKYLDPQHPNAAAFVAWLRRLLAAAPPGLRTA
ncbi:MAG: DUF3226 domain-containing protein [Planctomycetaceae bacterium]